MFSESYRMFRSQASPSSRDFIGDFRPKTPKSCPNLYIRATLPVIGNISDTKNTGDRKRNTQLTNKQPAMFTTLPLSQQSTFHCAHLCPRLLRDSTNQMGGNAQPDDRPLCGSELRPFFAVCGPKYTELSLPVRESPQFATPCSDLRCLVAFRRYSRSSREVVRNRAEILMFLGCRISVSEEGAPKFLTEFYKSESPTSMWQSSLTIGQATSGIRRRKKERIKKI